MKLSDPVSSIPMIGPGYVKKLKKLEINTVGDLIYHIPHRYSDFTNMQQIANLQIGVPATVVGQIVSMQNITTKNGKRMQIGKISDGTSTLEILWMNQPYIVNSLPLGTMVSVSGKLSFWGKKKVMSFPQYEKLPESGDTIHTGKLIPIYPETAGLSSKWLRSRVHAALQSIEPQELEDYLDKKAREDLRLVPLNDAIKVIHDPEDMETSIRAKQRLGFDELLMLHIENKLEKIKWQNTNKTNSISVADVDMDNFYRSLPFELTFSQKRSLSEIRTDLQRNFPMNRLLEGDVGSGKTAVAAGSAYMAAKNGFQTLLMAPTQILAAQHFATLSSLLEPFNIEVELVTAGNKPTNFEKTNIFVGTHALLHHADKFNNVGLVIIDEQHRFGVKQRAIITEKKSEIHPHVLTMTATPIPRTVALTLYGDLDLSTLDEQPKGRKPVTTWVVPPKKRDGAYGWIAEQIEKDGIQVFVVCPLIEESESETLQEVKSAKAEYERLKKIFPQYKIGLLHGRMSAQEKDKVLDEFRDQSTQILVSTPVVEVGVDIPNATIMLIEAADRFGLAQLHQLRGRVGRGSLKSYCLLFTESKSKKAQIRLEAMTKIKTGRELAEIDLQTRGPGEVFGVRQHGYSELKYADWSDIALIKKAGQFAEKVIAEQNKYSEILNYYKSKQPTAN